MIINKKIKNKNLDSHFSNLHKDDISKFKQKYYQFNSHKEVIGYKHLISLDTIYILMKLTKEQIVKLLSDYSYKHLFNTKEVYQYSITNNDNSIYIKLYPTFPSKYFNAEIQLQKGFTTRKHEIEDTLTADVLHLLNVNQDYWISRIDFAFDYLIPFKYSGSLKRHGKQKRQATGEEYYFNGSTGNKKKPPVYSHYNRNNKEPIKVEYANRFEVKTFYQRKDKMRFNQIDNRLIIKKLKKEIFVANLDDVPDLTEYEKELILKSKETDQENILQVLLSSKEYTNLRKRIVKCREPLEEIYIDNAHLIYDFLLNKVEYDT